MIEITLRDGYPVNRCAARRVLWILSLAIAGITVPGCDPQVAVVGLVTDTSGAPLPGVSVKVEGTEAFSVSNGTGFYGKRPGRLAIPPGEWKLRYIKTGFTTAEQLIDTGNGRSFEAPTVTLWPLPNARGIYDFTNHRYREWSRVEPERFVKEDGVPVFGTRHTPELQIGPELGLIVGHKVSPYDWRLSRLESILVLRDGVTGGGENAPTDTVWAESVRIPIQAVPLDEPEQQLWELRPARVLGAGTYALHWGAFEGDPTTDASAYIIEVTGPPVEEAALEPVAIEVTEN